MATKEIVSKESLMNSLPKILKEFKKKIEFKNADVLNKLSVDKDNNLLYDGKQITVNGGTLKISIVTSLPVTDIDSNTIYLVSNGSSKENNIYTEYLYVNNKWEVIGSTDVDLTDYVKKTELDNKLKDYTKTTDLNTKLNDYVKTTSIDNTINNSVINSFNKNFKQYNSSSTYAVNDYVIYNNNLYKCNTSISTTENFNISKWTLLIGNENILNVQYVSKLPTDNIKLNTIYVVQKTDDDPNNNNYAEYIYIDNKWEVIGGKNPDDSSVVIGATEW